MKGVVYKKYGSPDVLQLKDLDKPTPEDDEVLIKIHAASINSWDWDLLTGRPLEYRLFSGIFHPTKTGILGCDISGHIESVGRNAKLFKPGDEVFGDLCEDSWGGFAEYTCARESALTLKPSCLSHAEAAATPQAGLLALQGLCDKQKIEPNQKILVNGACGGVGTFAIQIAKSFGAEVTGVDSGEKADKMISLGADRVIDYTQEDFTKNGLRYDLILDVKSDRSVFEYRRALNPAGVYVTVGGKTGSILQVALSGLLTSLTRHKRYTIIAHKPNKNMDVLIALFESNKVIPVIDRCFPLSKTAEAFRYFGDGHFKGKVVITMDKEQCH